MDLIEIVLPKSGSLPADVPQSEINISEFDLFYVEAYRRNSLLVRVVPHLE